MFHAQNPQFEKYAHAKEHKDKYWSVFDGERSLDVLADSKLNRTQVCLLGSMSFPSPVS